MTVLPLSISRAHGVTAYAGNIYVVSNAGDGVAIVNVASFTETANSPVTFPGPGTCRAWNVNQFRGVAYINCNSEFAESKDARPGGCRPLS